MSQRGRFTKDLKDHRTLRTKTFYRASWGRRMNGIFVKGEQCAHGSGCRDRRVFEVEKKSHQRVFWITLADRRKKNQSDWKIQVHHKIIYILVLPGRKENKSPCQVYIPSGGKKLVALIVEVCVLRRKSLKYPAKAILSAHFCYQQRLWQDEGLRRIGTAWTKAIYFPILSWSPGSHRQ